MLLPILGTAPERPNNLASAAAGSDGAARPGRSGGVRGVPVIVTTVERRDVPIYLTGLGRIQASNTVTVSSRVDGHLQSVNFREGQDVKAGDILAQIDPRPFEATLRQMDANLKREQARLAAAKADLARVMQLGRSDFASRQSIDNQQSMVSQTEAAIDAARAQIDNARTQLGYTTIRSPIDGRTGIRLVDAGNIVRALDPSGIVVVTQIQPISLLFSLPEEHVVAVHREQSRGEPLEVTALSRDSQTELARGTLTTIDNVIDEKTGTFKLKATFANDQRTLWPGQFVNARLLLAMRRDGTVVPAQVVQRGPDGPFAFVVRADETVEMRPLRVGQIQGGSALIESGLVPGERVVLEGQFKLEPGSRVIAEGGTARP